VLVFRSELYSDPRSFFITVGKLPVQSSEIEKSRKKLERLAWYLDSFIKIPGLNARIGFDGLIGLIPGVGDTIGC